MVWHAVCANAPKPSINVKHICAFLLRPAQKQSTSSLSKLSVLNIKSISSKWVTPRSWELGSVFARSTVKVTRGRSWDAVVWSSRNMVLRVKAYTYFWTTSRTAKENGEPSFFFYMFYIFGKLFSFILCYLVYERSY